MARLTFPAGIGGQRRAGPLDSYETLGFSVITGF